MRGNNPICPNCDSCNFERFKGIVVDRENMALWQCISCGHIFEEPCFEIDLMEDDDSAEEVEKEMENRPAEDGAEHDS